MFAYEDTYQQHMKDINKLCRHMAQTHAPATQ